MRLIHQIFRQPCWHNISHKANSTNTAIPILDALRGVAALVVLAAHTGVIPSDNGAYGVIIFFCLSGFLLTLPFADNQKINPLWLIAYLNRRLLRIIPLYTVYIGVAFFFFGGGVSWLINHMFFIKSDGHLWTIKQELYFYALLPLIIIWIHHFRGNHLLSGVVLLCIAYILGIHLTEKFISSTNMHGEKMRLYISPFICGMAFAYFYRKYMLLKSRREFQKHLEIIGIILSISLLIIFITLNRKNLWHHSGFEIGFLCSASIFSLLAISNTVFLTILLPLRAIGVVGYSFYLFHWIVKDALITLNISSYFQFLASIFVTYFISCLTYVTIEYPCIEIGKTISNKILKRHKSKKAA